MYIYNVTVHVEPTVEEAWLSWMKNHHLPEMMNTGQFENAQIFKIINDQDHGGVSYATQYTCASIKEYDTYIKTYSSALRKSTVDRFGNAVLTFRTQLKEVYRLG